MSQAVVTGQIIEAPKAQGGVRTCRVKMGPNGARVTARINTPGRHYPYKVGDTVELLVSYGDPAAGVYVRGLFRQPPTPLDQANVEAHGRSGDYRIYAPNGSVLLHGSTVQVGEDPDGTYEVVSLHPRTAQEIAILREMVQIVAAAVDSVAGGSAVTTAVDALELAPDPLNPGEIIGPVRGGDPAANLHAEKETGP